MRRAEWKPGQADPVLAEGDFRIAYCVRYDDVVSGMDDAVVAFVDGWMVVEGRQASFSLRPCDVDRMGDGSVTLAGGGWLQFDAYERAAEFERALIDWCWEAASPEGDPVFPPARVHLSLLSRAYARTAAWSLGIVFAAALWIAGAPLVGLFAAPFVALGMYADGREALRLVRLSRRTDISPMGRQEVG